MSEVDSMRNHAIVSSLAGYPFLLSFSFAWIVASVLSYVLPLGVAVWVYPLAGVPGIAVAMFLERRIGYMPPADPEPFASLGVQILFVQIVAFPAVAIVWALSPQFMPVAFAVVVGAHFLPFQWLYRTRLYGVLGLTISAGSYGLAAVAGTRALHYTGFFVGGSLLAGAFFARSHAATVWRQHGATLLADQRLAVEPLAPGTAVLPAS